jgi:hypothetical protein
VILKNAWITLGCDIPPDEMIAAGDDKPVDIPADI